MTSRRFGCERQQLVEVARRPVQVGLQDAADVVVAALAELAVDAERRVDDGGLLHVDAHRVAERGGMGDDRGDVLERELLVDAAGPGA